MRKIIAVLVAIATCLCLFAACGEKEHDGKSQGEQGLPPLGFGDKDKDKINTESKDNAGNDKNGEETPAPQKPVSVWKDTVLYVDTDGQWHYINGMDGTGNDIALGVYINKNNYRFDKPYIPSDEYAVAFDDDGENIYFRGQSQDNKKKEVVYGLDKNGNVKMLTDDQSGDLLQKGGTVLFRANDEALYSCTDGKVIKLAEDVTYYRFSDDGEGVWFGRRDDDLDYSFWYVPANGNAPAKNIIPTDGARRVYFGTQENVLIYNVEKEDPNTGSDTYSIWISRAGKTPELIVENATDVSHCEYGDTFFYRSGQSGKNEWYWYDGEESILAADMGIEALGTSEMNALGENAEQNIYYQRSRLKDDVYTHTYIYRYGDITGTINCTTESSYYYSESCGFLNGEQAFVTCGDKLVLHNLNSQDPDDNIIIDIYDVTFMPETETLFYITDDESVYLYENGESRLFMSGSSWPKVDMMYGDKTYIVLEAEYENTSESYISRGTLKICKGDDRAETIGTDCTFFTYTREGKLLFVANDVLYSYDGENTVRLADNALRAYPGSLDKGE